MKRSDKAIKAASYVAGVFSIAASMLLVVFLILSLVGLIHPRRARITLHTDSISKIYDGTPLRGSEPVISYGTLYDGHSMEIRYIPEYIETGEYANAPVIVILDETGADVTAQYDITQDFGDMTVQAREIMLVSPDKSKVYDGEPLTADEVWVGGGTLAWGHTLISEGGNALILPGVEKIRPVYRILSENGADVTDQYAVTESFGDLEVLPIEITLTTESANKTYDGEKLSAPGWEHVGGKLLDGHTVVMTVTASIDDVGSVMNEGEARVTDESGKDVSFLYKFDYRFGSLEINGIPLHITTQSAQKVYDGKPLVCGKWEITKGKLKDGETIQVQEYAVCDSVGSVDNAMRFLVTDKNGRDITYRYSFTCNYGTLSIQPRAINIRTGSAQKKYDGTPLSCSTYEIISGSLCDGDRIDMACTSIVNLGYSDNYVLDCTIYRVEADGTLTDVSACYRITFDYGTLKITSG